MDVLEVGMLEIQDCGIGLDLSNSSVPTSRAGGLRVSVSSRASMSHAHP